MATEICKRVKAANFHSIIREIVTRSHSLGEMVHFEDWPDFNTPAIFFAVLLFKTTSISLNFVRQTSFSTYVA